MTSNKRLPLEKGTKGWHEVGGGGDWSSLCVSFLPFEVLTMLVINQKWVKINSEITFFPSPSPPASPEVALLTVWHDFFQILLHVLLYVFVHIHMYEAVCLFCLVLFYINVFIQVILKLVFSPLVICIMSWNFSLIHRSKLSFKAFFKILNFLNRKIKEPFLWEK